MAHIPDFESVASRGLIDGCGLISVNVIYYLPDHPSLLQEFIWQFVDLRPRYPRLARFLDHWRREVRTPIREVLLLDAPITGGRWRNAAELGLH